MIFNDQTAKQNLLPDHRILNWQAVRALLIWSVVSLLAVAASAQSYPSRPVRIVIPLSSGGTTDIPGRIIAQRLTDVFGQQFFVENRPGAGGTIGTDFVAKSKPDGVHPAHDGDPACHYRQYVQKPQLQHIE